MSKRIAYFDYGRVYPQPDDAPLVDGGEPVVPGPKPEYEPPRLHICRVLLVLWCIAFVAILGASYIYVIMYPLDPADHVWQAIPLGVLGALLAWGITFVLYICARRHQ